MNTKYKYKFIAVGVLCTLIILSCLFYYLYVSGKKNRYEALSITFQSNQIIEYGNKEIKAEDLVKSHNGKKIVYPNINTMKVGTQELTFILFDGDIEKKVLHTITIEDTQKPKIVFKKDKIVIYVNESYDPNTNIKEIKDVIDGNIPQSNTKGKNSYWIDSKIDVKKPGTYEVIVKAIDQHNLKSEKSFQVIVKDRTKEPEQEKPNEVPTVKAYYVNNVLIVNKKHGLPQDYAPGVNPTAYQELLQLQQDATKQGLSLPLLSGYRSYSYQSNLYQSYVARDGKVAADRYSAQPGYSEHQTGLAFDIGQLNSQFGQTQAGIWLANHAHEYGFIIRYPQGKEHITGYMYEPWHIRFLGKELATQVYQSKLTLEEYFGIS